jgi:hypothetical protein
MGERNIGLVSSLFEAPYADLLYANAQPQTQRPIVGVFEILPEPSCVKGT